MAASWVIPPSLSITAPLDVTNSCIGIPYTTSFAVVSPAAGLTTDGLWVGFTPVNSWSLYHGSGSPNAGNGVVASFTPTMAGTFNVQSATRGITVDPPWDSGGIGSFTPTFKVFEVASLDLGSFAYGPDYYVFTADPNVAVLLTEYDDLAGDPWQLNRWLMITATPNPSVTDLSELPNSWQFSGGSVATKVRTFVDRSQPTSVGITANAGTSYKYLNCYVYKASLRICVDPTSVNIVPPDFDSGHAWFDLEITPHATVSYIDPALRPYIGWAGYFPVGRGYYPCPGVLKLGSVDASGGRSASGNPPYNGDRTWAVDFVSFVSMLSDVESVYVNPGTYSIVYGLGSQCCGIAVGVAACGGICCCLDSSTPWSLMNSFNFCP
jgi:hypothetical protein